jgi:N-acetylglucosamine-6-sulfatase
VIAARAAILAAAASLALAACGDVKQSAGTPRAAARPPSTSMQPAPTPSPLAAARGRPNLILFMTDDQALGDMSAMPLVQQHVASQGVTFDNSFASWPLCCPSRATAFTGQYAHNHKVLGNYPPAGGHVAFVDDDETLAVWLQRAGYQTSHVGKYLNMYGVDGRGATYVPPGWSQWHGLVDPSTYRMWGYTINHNGKLRNYGAYDDEDPALYQTDVLRDVALDQINRFAHGTQPFFLSIAPLAPHEEIEEVHVNRGYPGPRPAPRHQGSLAHVPLPMPPSFDEREMGDKPKVVAAFAQVFAGESLAQRAARHRRRLESLRSVDEAIAAIIARLAQLHLLDNTYFVFTSDNGWFNGEHRIAVGKFLMYEPSIRVPLIVRGPGVPAGRRSDELVANVDLAPTFVELAGAAARRVMDGRSLMAYARDPSLRTNRPILLDAPLEQVLGQSLGKGKPPVAVPPLRGLRTQRFSYVEYGTGEVELYNLVEDPYQLRSRHNDPTMSGLQAGFRKAVAHYATCAGDSCRADIGVAVPRAAATRRSPPRARPAPAR